MMTVRNPSRDPFYNQAFEEVVFERFADDDVFFLWQNDPAVVVGSYQNICREVHVPSLRRMGVPVVRRLVRRRHGLSRRGKRQLYLHYPLRRAGGTTTAALSPVIDALNRHRRARAEGPHLRHRASDGRKISGSAQRHGSRGGVLHHGTLLFQSDLSVLDQITTRRKNDCFRSRRARCPTSAL